jgi:OOP family OmpA-OmpF porin
MHQLEFGGYGSVTRYDHLMGLKWRVGAGARLGYSLTSALGLEIEGGFAQPKTQTPLVFTTARWASASVVLNVRAGRNTPYLLGGYTRIDYGGATDAPYNFGDHAVHGAIGDRIRLIEGVALRLEGRAIFAPRTDARFGGSWAGHVVGSFGLSMFALGRRTPVRPQPVPTRPIIVKPADADADGVADGVDQCADSPAGAGVDVRGCPLDADGDGVADGFDRCPATARGAAVDAAGCSAANLDVGRLFGVMRGVGFEAGGSSLTAGSYARLNDVAATLIAHPELRVEIAVYTDESGVPGTIVRQTQLRAEVIRSYLAGRGVASSRMVARGYGSASPIASNATPAGRAQNRRVELHRVP